VIGAGVLGASVAVRLAEAGISVTLLDQDQPGRGTSRWSFAWLNSNDKGPRPYHDLNHAGLQAWADLAPHLDGPSWYRPVGHLELAPTAPGLAAPELPTATPGLAAPEFPAAAPGLAGPEFPAAAPGLAGPERAAAAPELAARVSRLASWGYPARLIDPAEAARLEPALLRPGRAAALAWFPDEAYLLTEPLIARLVARLTSHGGTVLTGGPGRVTALGAGPGGTARIRTAAGAMLEADQVVCCAGRWTPGLAALAGAPGTVPLVAWDTPGSIAPALVVRVGPVGPDGPVRVIHTPRIALRPHPGGLLQLEAPDLPADLHTPEADLRRLAGELLDRARHTVRGLDQARIVTIKVCVRPLPADEQSIVGRLPGAEWLYVAVTHSGVTLAAHLSRLIAAELAPGPEAPAPDVPGQEALGPEVLGPKAPGTAALDPESAAATAAAALTPYRPARFAGKATSTTWR
jgi:D-hydroxyproline dehydrogenase subunit beta